MESQIFEILKIVKIIIIQNYLNVRYLPYHSLKNSIKYLSLFFDLVVSPLQGLLHNKSVLHSITFQWGKKSILISFIIVVLHIKKGDIKLQQQYVVEKIISLETNLFKSFALSLPLQMKHETIFMGKYMKRFMMLGLSFIYAHTFEF